MSLKENVKSYGSKVLNSDALILFPIIFCMAVIPLIVRYKEVPMSLQTLVVWNWRAKSNGDFFSYCKMFLLLIVTALAIIIFLAKLFYSKQTGTKLIKKTKLYIPISVFGYFVLISTIISTHKDVAIFGFPDRYEGMLAVLAYLFIMLFAITFINTKKQLKIILGFLFLSAIVFSIIGLVQYFGIDLLLTPIGRHIILPAKNLNMAIESSSKKYTIISTIYNSNYVGSYMSLIFPVSLIVFLKLDKPYKKIISAIVCLIFFSVLIGCNSRAGYMGVFVEMVVLLIIFRKKLIENIKSVIPLLIGFVIIFNLFNSLGGVSITGRMGKALSTKSLLACQLNDIKMTDKKLQIICANETLNVKLYDKNIISFFDTKNNKLKPVVTAEVGKNKKAVNYKVTFKDKLYKRYVVYYLIRTSTIRITKQELNVSFKITKNGFRILDKYYQAHTFPKIKSFGFKGKETWGTNRGYIWSRSFPLLLNTIIVGHGPDTFAFYFPQNDYLGKIINYGNPYILVDKPHDYYLQLGINTGVISLISMLVFFGAYFIWSIRIYIKKDYKTLFDYIGGAIFLSFCGYIVSLTFNDSVVSVAPIFWAMLGIGISINRKVSAPHSEEIPDSAVRPEEPN